MRNFLIIGLFFISFSAQSQIKALTENGKEVLLFENGTWKYSEDADGGNVKKDSLTVNTKKFEKSPLSTFLVKSNTTSVGVYIDPSKWTFKPNIDNQAGVEYRFTLKTSDGYAMLITERMEIGLELMRIAAVNNARKVAPDAAEAGAEYRIVNGKKVLCLKITGTMQGVKFVYLGYYYSFSKGTVQLVTYTSQNLFSEVQKELETFLNGLVEINK